jgi:hypothetical protein
MSHFQDGLPSALRDLFELRREIRPTRAEVPRWEDMAVEAIQLGIEPGREVRLSRITYTRADWGRPMTYII